MKTLPAAFLYVVVSLAVVTPSWAQSPITIVAANTSNTGQDGSGGMLTAGTADTLWQLVGYDNSYGFTTTYQTTHPSDVAVTYAPVSSSSNSVPSTIPEASYVVQNAPGAWATYPGQAEFVSAVPNQANGGMPGTYIYRFTFTSPISGLVTFSGSASADNGLRIVYDGTTVASYGGQLLLSTAAGWVAGTSTEGGSNADIPTGGSVYGNNAAPFLFTEPIVMGTNTLDFYVSNFNDAAYSGDEEGLIVTDFSITVVPEPRDYAFYLLGLGIALTMLRRTRQAMAA